MSLGLLMDFFLINSQQFIPSFFLIGFTREKKTSILSFFTYFIIYDLWIYQTFGKMTLLLIFLILVKKFIFKHHPIIQFNLIIFLFFSGLIFLNHLSLQFLLEKKIWTTFILLNLCHILVRKY